ncbi:MAG: hypothetical protein VYB82_01330 [Pseudomonadota bacterium]|nr:hypothetical protein [Pseudomonadota bacterium]
MTASVQSYDEKYAELEINHFLSQVYRMSDLIGPVELCQPQREHQTPC